MSENTNIEWCDSTFNPWIGCTKVSLACDDCYAARSTPARAMGIVWGPKEARHRTAPGTWAQPKRWEREHEAFSAIHGRRRRVFCASLADVFDNEVPVMWRVDLFRLIAETPNLDWLLLTKRIGNVPRMLEEVADCTGGGPNLPANVLLGATIVNQDEYDRDIGKLLRTPAHARFLSIEPMLGSIDMRMGGASTPDYAEHRPLPRLDWVIVGGESGPQSRPMHPDWARSLRDQCKKAGVPFLFKQWGEWGPARDADVIERGEGIGGRLTMSGAFAITPNTLQRLGKKAAGRVLDGALHDGYPS